MHGPLSSGSPTNRLVERSGTWHSLARHRAHPYRERSPRPATARRACRFVRFPYAEVSPRSLRSTLPCERVFRWDRLWIKVAIRGGLRSLGRLPCVGPGLRDGTHARLASMARSASRRSLVRPRRDRTHEIVWLFFGVALCSAPHLLFLLIENAPMPHDLLLPPDV